MKTRPLRHHVRTLGMLPALIILCIGLQILSGGHFLTGPNIGVVLHQMAVDTVLAAGMTFVVLAGGIDLSVSSIMAVCAVAGLTTANIAGLSPVWPLICLVVGCGFGLANGLLIFGLRLPPFIVTLASSTVVLGIARLLSDDLTIYSPHLPFAALGSSRLFGMPTLSFIAFAVIAMSWFMLKRTVLGVAVYAVGGNAAAAQMSGIDVRRVHLVVYSLSGLLAGLGAVMMSSKVLAANALQLGQSYTLEAIAAVILGGTSFGGGVGSIWGTLTGALIMVALSNGLVLSGVSDMWQQVIRGLVIIGAVAMDRARAMRAVRV